MKVPKWLIIAIIALVAILIIFGKTILPYQLKLSHARSFAKSQLKYMQEEMKDGESIGTAVALTQAKITDEHMSNTDTEYTIYTINVDEKEKTYHIDVEVSYGKHYTKFSTKKVSYGDS